MAHETPSALIVTYLPSPYQVELFNAIAASGRCKLSVIYLRKQESTPVASRWALPVITHEHWFADSPEFCESVAVTRMMNADLAVLNFYRHPVAAHLLDARARASKAWAFWGERPGVSGHGWFGKIARRFKLASLHRSRAPIWGIGAWAVAAWQAEFGFARVYHDVPYFSDLNRFTIAVTQRLRDVEGGKTRFLFSGSLIERKGCDLIATAFSRLAKENANVELHWAGNGPLEGVLRETLRGCAERVKFYGFVAWDALPAVYAEADVLLAPSRHDGWALVVPEGLAAGLPVISTTKAGAALELIRHGENGWLIAPGDGEALYRAMKQAVCRSPEMRNAAMQSVDRHQLRDGVSRFNGAVASALL
jgi:glycosyltransferase involved in cell wall biosynthesis